MATHLYRRGEPKLGLLDRLRTVQRKLAGSGLAQPMDFEQQALAAIELGNAAEDAGDLDRAMAHYESAIETAPTLARGHLNRGNVLLARGDIDAAVRAYETALSANPRYAAAYYNIGNIHYSQRRLDAALVAFDHALAIDSGMFVAEVARANTLADCGHLDAAVASYQRALDLRPGAPEVLSNLGLALNQLKDYAQAARCFSAALERAPQYPYALGNLYAARVYGCDWSSYQRDVDAMHAAVRSRQRAVTPFHFMIAADTSEALLHCCEVYVADKFPASPVPLYSGPPYKHDRIRVAYLSADFHSHATAALMAGLFEAHDKARFEIFAISFGRDDGSAMRQRLRAAFDHFIDVRSQSDRDIAILLRNLEIDIAVDLKGYTAQARPGILAQRPAPLQINYLGFPGTMGASYIDYLIADEQVVPETHLPFYREKVIYLPGSYQVNDAMRPIAEQTPTRASAGLPESGFVYCCFNNTYKITPKVFDIWMRLLERCRGSVLWLLDDNPTAVANLRKEATQRGVDPDRLVFAPRLELAEHLARQRLADLFLDTLPCNAHTTASDALWVGLPVLTRRGNTFAGAVAASLLHAIGLDDLVVTSAADYEAVALRLFDDRQALDSLRSRLRQNRHSSALFDTQRFRVNIEAAYQSIWERHCRGEPVASLRVQDCA